MTTKRKRIVLTLEEKLEVIQSRDSGYSIDKIAEKYNIGASTVSEIYKKRVEIENAVEKSKSLGGVKRKTLKEGKRPVLEDELSIWIDLQINQGILPQKADIFTRAREIDKQNNPTEFDWSPSNTWFKGFCDRYGFKLDSSSHHIAKEESIHIEGQQDSKLALESAEYLLAYMDSRDFALKDIITVRMVRDKIANE